MCKISAAKEMKRCVMAGKERISLEYYGNGTRDYPAKKMKPE
jgi:hypothetical protein